MKMKRYICWTYDLIEWLGKGIYHLGNKEVEATKAKRKTYGRQYSWDDKITEEFVPRHLAMRQTKQII